MYRNNIENEIADQIVKRSNIRRKTHRKRYKRMSLRPSKSNKLSIGDKVQIVLPAEVLFSRPKYQKTKDLISLNGTFGIITHIKSSTVLLKVDKYVRNFSIKKEYLNVLPKKHSSSTTTFARETAMSIFVNFSISQKDREKNSITEDHIDLCKRMVTDLYNTFGYVFIKFLGRGGFGLVCQFRDKSGNQYAIKILYKKRSTKANIEKLIDSNRFIVENIEKCGNYADFILTSQMKHVNDNYYIISEPLTLNLSDITNNYRHIISYGKDIICQLIYGIYCLHEIGVIHGDIKLENIFIKMKYNSKVPSKYEAKLKFADFDGSGRVIDGKLIVPVTIASVSW